jgi:hypothetical protein
MSDQSVTFEPFVPIQSMKRRTRKSWMRSMKSGLKVKPASRRAASSWA